MADGKYYAVMHARSQDPVEVIDSEEILIQGLSYTKWQEITFRARVIEPAFTIRIIVGIRLEGTKGGSAGGSIDLVLIDPETGQYGFREQWEERQKEKNIPRVLKAKSGLQKAVKVR
jgi:hypothetical protein